MWFQQGFPCLRFTSVLHHSSLQVQLSHASLGTLAMQVEANENQLTPSESMTVYLMSTPCQIKARVKVCLSMIGPS